MRIDGTIPYFIPLKALAGRIPENTSPQHMNYYGQRDTIEISQQAWDTYNKSKIAPERVNNAKAAQEFDGCQVCDSRKYVDVSNDASVSYQSPQHISPEQAASRVLAHEREHVSNEQAKAEKNDRKVVSQSVSLSTSICPDCGKVYVSGGVTRTITKSNDKSGTPEVNSSPDASE